jgi:hypothetical protein
MARFRMTRTRAEQDKIEACVVRVESNDGQPQGAGFLAGPALAVTCVHVVEACGAGPGGLVRLTFRVGSMAVEAEVLARSTSPHTCGLNWKRSAVRWPDWKLV